MQAILIALIVAFSTGFLSSCKVSYNYYKVKDLKQQVLVAKERAKILESTVKEADILEDKAVAKKKERELVYQQITVPVAIAVPGSDAVCVDANGMRNISRLRN